MCGKDAGLEKTSVEMFYRLLWSVQRLDQSRCTRLQPSMSLSSSSPTLAPSMSNLTPAFTFTLAIIFRFYLLFFFFLESEEQVDSAQNPFAFCKISEISAVVELVGSLLMFIGY